LPRVNFFEIQKFSISLSECASPITREPSAAGRQLPHMYVTICRDSILSADLNVVIPISRCHELFGIAGSLLMKVT